MRFAHQIAVVLVTFLCASVTSAQWKQLADFNSQIVSIYFQVDESRQEVGFVGTANGKVWRTTDHGTTWSQTITTSPFPTFLSGRITSFTFKDSMIGWFSALEQSSNPCVYKTIDGGLSWVADTLYGNGTSITYNKPYGNLILTTWSGYNAVSPNSGGRWFSIGIREPMCGVTFCNPRFGIMTGTLSEPIATSGDGGRTWTQAQVVEEMWHPLGFPNSGLAFGVAEISRQVMRSYNSGGEWTTIKQFSNIDLTGYIGGTLNALFLQAKDGIYVSRDTGQSWQSFCGPGNDYDTRMYVHGDTVYAGTIDGKLFANFYGVTHRQDLLEFSRTQIDFSSVGCFRLDSAIHLTNVSTCEKVKLESVDVSGSAAFGVFAQQLPKVLNANDSLKIFYTPNDLIADSAELVITYSIGGTPFVKKIKLKGNGKQGLNLGFGKEMEILLASDCAKLDTFITIKNGPCDSVSILSAVVSDSSTFTLTPPQLPHSIGPNGSIKIAVGVNTVTPGDYTATVRVLLTNGKTTVDTSITLKLKVLTSKDALVTLSKPLIRFDSVSTCEVKFDTIRITNTICKPIVIDNVTLVAPVDPAITIISVPLQGESLNPNESAMVILAYSPSLEVPLTATLKVRTGFDVANFRDSLIEITGFGKAFNDAALLNASLTFPPMLECEITEVESWIVNYSCDSATIVGIDGATDGGFQLAEPPLLTMVGPGDTVHVRVLVGPISGGSKFDSVGIRIRTRSGAERLLKLTLLGTVTPKIRSLAMPETIALDSLAPCATFDTTITIVNYGICDTLIIDSVVLAGASWINFDPLGLPVQLMPKDTLRIRLHLAPPANGRSSGALRIFGNGLDTSFLMSAGTGAFIDPMPLNMSDSVFTAFLCKNARQYIVLSNPLCDTLVIDNISLTGSSGQFQFTSALTLPLRILPGTDTTLEIVFDPSMPGDSTALLVIGSGDHNITKRIPLLGSYRNTKGTAGIEAVISDGSKNILIGEGEFFTMEIRANNFIEKARDLSLIECTLRFNDNVLTAQNQSYLWGGPDVYQRDSGFIFFRMKRTTYDDIQPNQVLASVTFMTTIGDSSFSPIDLSVRLNPGDSLYEQCVLQPLAMPSIRVDINDTCGDAIIRKWINRRLDIFDNFSIVPNPSNGAEDVLVTFDLLHDQDVTLSMFDANGKKLRDEFYPALRKGKHKLRMATDPLAEGWCFIMVESPGQRDMKKLVLRK